MFAVLCEVHPETEQWDAYLGLAKMLKPELEKIDGFVDNIRYKSLTRDGRLLSLSWDVFDAVLTPDDLILMLSWRDEARACEEITHRPDGARLRRVRVVRDYGMFDRRAAPQYYPDAKGGTTIHA